MSIVLIRHTRLADVTGLCYGWCDLALAESFAEEARQVKEGLPWKPDEVWTSPATRCRALADTFGVGTVIEEPRLRELHMGEWEGRRWEEFRGAESEAWAQNPWRRRPPGGESAEAFWARVAEVREVLLRVAGERRVAVVTHAGVIRAWRGIAERRGFDEMMRQPVAFGSVTPGR